MKETTIIYILSFMIIFGMPFIAALAKDASKLFSDVKIGLEDGKLSPDEIDIILKDVGVILRSIVRLIEKVT